MTRPLLARCDGALSIQVPRREGVILLTRIEGGPKAVDGRGVNIPVSTAQLVRAISATLATRNGDAVHDSVLEHVTAALVAEGLYVQSGSGAPQGPSRFAQAVLTAAERLQEHEEQRLLHLAEARVAETVENS